LTNDEKEILEKLNASDRFKPRPGAGDKSFFDKVKDLFQN
jgi:molecular chaperone DnaJ